MLRISTIIMAIVTLLLLFCMLVCGLWIGSNSTDAAGISFHKTLGISATIAGAVTCVLALVSSGKKRCIKNATN